MKKLFLLFSIVFLFGCSDRPSSEIAKEVNYYFSEDETACAFIFYDVEDAPALTIRERVVYYHFGEQNILATSSPLDFGWSSKESSACVGHISIMAPVPK